MIDLCVSKSKCRLPNMSVETKGKITNINRLGMDGNEYLIIWSNVRMLNHDSLKIRCILKYMKNWRYWNFLPKPFSLKRTANKGLPMVNFTRIV